MKKIAFLLSLSLLIVFASCKKDKNDPDSDEDPVTPAATHPDGYLKYYQSINIATGGATTINYNTSAYFYSSNKASDFVSIDSMSLNNVYLTRAKDSTYHTSKAIPGSVCNWHVEGKRGIPDFDYKNFPIPSFTNFASIPDSISLQKDLNISLAGTGNFVKSKIIIFDVVGKSISKEIKPGNTNVTYTATELSTFNKYANFYVYINFINYRTDTISEKAFYFETQVSVDKYVMPY